MTRKNLALFLLAAAPVAAGIFALIFGYQHQQEDAAPAAQHGDLTFYHPRLYAVVPGSPATAGYVVIANNGGDDNVLLSVSAAFAGAVQIHETTDKNGVSKMRPLPDGLAVAAGGRAELVPGGKHLMFMDISSPPPVGDKTPVVLFFSGGQEVTVDFPVIKRGDDAHEHRH